MARLCRENRLFGSSTAEFSAAYRSLARHVHLVFVNGGYPLADPKHSLLHERKGSSHPMNSRHSSFAPTGRPAGKTARMLHCAAAILCAFGWGVAQADPIPPSSYIYGIDDANYLWQLDPVSKTSLRVYQTVLTGISNALAYDNGRSDLYAVDGSNDLWWWNAVIDAPVKVATAAQLGLSPTNADDQPWSAAYYNGRNSQIAMPQPCHIAEFAQFRRGAR